VAMARSSLKAIVTMGLLMNTAILG
jgi:hypothetical protein